MQVHLSFVVQATAKIAAILFILFGTPAGSYVHRNKHSYMKIKGDGSEWRDTVAG